MGGLGCNPHGGAPERETEDLFYMLCKVAQGLRIVGYLWHMLPSERSEWLLVGVGQNHAWQHTNELDCSNDCGTMLEPMVSVCLVC